MAMSSKRIIPAIIACLSVAGCNTAGTHIGDEDPGMGEAVKYDAALQTINPAPVYGPDAAQPGSNGAKGAAAVKRYRTDQVIEPVSVQTTIGSEGSMVSSGGPH
jgi:hypothetical protein